MIHMISMSIMTDAELLKLVETFLEKTEMAPTRFGREVMADGALVQHLRAGRSLSLSNANKLVDFMATYRTPKAARVEQAA